MGLTVLDSGVLIAVMDRDDVHHATARAAVSAALREDDLVLPASAYTEVLVLPSRLGGDAVRQAEGFIDDLPARVEPASRQIAASAAALRARFGRSLKLPDALVIATAQAVMADRIITTDRGWPDAGVTVQVVAGRP